MKPFSFVHSADLHLGSPIKGVGNHMPEALDALRSVTYDAFDALITFCLEREVAFLLVAGDVVDDADHALRAQLAFRDGMVRLGEKNIHAFVVHGNHDPATAWSTRILWPENLHLFGTEDTQTMTVPVDNIPAASICGISFAQKNEQRPLIDKFHAAHPGLFRIGLLHTSCGHHPDHKAYAPCTPGQLREAGYHYWALGHVHERAVLSEAPYIVYPGNIQGLHIRETGPRGCYLVNVNETHQVEMTFHALDRVRWVTIQVDTTSIDTLDALEQAIFWQLEDASGAADGRCVIARIILVGRSPLYSTLRKDETAGVLLERTREAGMGKTPAVWAQDMRVNCFPPVDLSRRRQVNDFLGQVLREAESLRLSLQTPSDESSDLLPRALGTALGELFHHPRLSRLLAPLTNEDCEQLFIEAERLCLDLLEPGA